MNETDKEQGYTEEKGDLAYKEDVGWIEKPEPGEYEPNEGVYQE